MSRPEHRGVPVETHALGVLLLVLVTARTGWDPVERAVPFIGLFDHIGTAHQWALGTSVVFFSGAALALFSRFFRFGCGLAGVALIAKVIASMPGFSNGRLFDGLMLLLIALCVTERSRAILRAQVLVLYAGASLSKALDPDWWNGRFMTAILEHHLAPGPFDLASRFAVPAGLLSMATESLILVALATPALRNYGVALTTVFHTAILITLNEDFASFYCAVALSSALLFLRLPDVRGVSTPSRGLCANSVFPAIREAPWTRGPASVDFARGRLEGAGARLFLTLSHLPSLALVVAIPALCGQHGLFWTRTALASLAAAAALGSGAMVACATRARPGKA